MAQHDGGCSCGAVRYRLTSDPIWVNCCHCTLCQRQTGSAFVINALIEVDRIETLQGEFEVTEVASGSGAPHDLYRCSQCRVVVWSDYGRKRPIRFVRVGTLDDSSALPPNVHVWVKSKLDWVVIPEGAPQYDEYFDVREVWPEESLARMRAAR